LLSDRDTAQDDGADPDPNPIAHDDVSMESQTRLTDTIMKIFNHKIMGRCFEAYPGTDHASIADRDPRISARKPDFGIDKRLIPDRKAAYRLFAETLLENERT